PRFRLGYSGNYLVSGAPVVVSDLASTITGSIIVLLVGALLVMAATLLLVFRGRLRLLPLAIALAACGITFGVIALLGGTLTMASIAVLPILIGLAVDYAIQFQTRVAEARQLSTRAGLQAPRVIARAAGTAMPAIGTAALATATGFLVLQLSPVPMVRGFGVLLVVGIAVALACTVAVAAAATVLASRGESALPLRGAPADGRRRVPRVLGSLLASLRGAVMIVNDALEALGLARFRRAIA